jgi:plasmid rolling circle replication initiator protein Rep
VLVLFSTKKKTHTQKKGALFLNYDSTISGKILQDTKNGKEKPWREKKIKSILLSESYSRLGWEGRAERTYFCGKDLNFLQCPNDGHKKLIGAKFCRDRMCPMCNWRRSRKLQGQIYQVVHEAVKQKKMRFIFLTLTVRNPCADELEDTVKMILKGLHSLLQYKDVEEPVIGFVRNLEVRYNKKKDSYHPHIHVLLAVKPEYFGKGYIKHKKWAELWQRACKLDYIPVVYVTPVKKRDKKDEIADMAFEIGKYIAKDSDYIDVTDQETADKVTSTMAMALKGRRMISFGKMFREIHKNLNLEDVEDENADLVSANEKKECKCDICGTNLFEQLYRWRYGYNVYTSDD